MNEMEIRNRVIMFRFAEMHKNIANKANKYFNKDGIDLQMEQFPVLMIPFFRGAISQQDIADFTLRDKSSVLRSIASLAAKGLLVTAQDPFDKRKKMVQVTKEGRKLAEAITEELIKINDLFFSCLSDEENNLLTGLLKKCEKHIAAL